MKSNIVIPADLAADLAAVLNLAASHLELGNLYAVEGREQMVRDLRRKLAKARADLKKAGLHHE